MDLGLPSFGPIVTKTMGQCEQQEPTARRFAVCTSIFQQPPESFPHAADDSDLASLTSGENKNTQEDQPTVRDACKK